MKLKNKFAVVTGASTGIGRAIAIEFGKQQAFIAIVTRSRDKLNKTKKLIEKNGGKAEIFITDLSNIDSINSLISDIKSKTKRVDIIVNVAGVWHGKNELYAGKDFKNFKQEVITETYNVGIIAPTLLIHGLLSLMPKGACIINISGTFESGAKGWLPYYVSKKSLEDLTIGLAVELKNKEINVNAVSPSDVATEEYLKYFPKYAKDALNPEEIAKFIASLCSSKAYTGKVFVVKKGKKPFEGYHR